MLWDALGASKKWSRPCLSLSGHLFLMPRTEYLLFMPPRWYDCDGREQWCPEPLLVPHAAITEEHRRLYARVLVDQSEDDEIALREALHSIPGGLKALTPPLGSCIVSVWAPHGGFWCNY